MGAVIDLAERRPPEARITDLAAYAKLRNARAEMRRREEAARRRGPDDAA